MEEYEHRAAAFADLAEDFVDDLGKDPAAR